MRAVTIPETGSKRTLLAAAEQLFAEKGFEAVSVRDITQLAKVDVAAVNLSRFIRYSPVGLRDGAEAPVKEIPQAIFDF